MLAAISETPELILSKDEGKMLAEGIAKVSKHYETGILSEKQLDWINLFSAAGMIYGSRIMMIRMRVASEAARDVTPKPNTERPAPPNPNGPIDPAFVHAMQP